MSSMWKRVLDRKRDKLNTLEAVSRLPEGSVVAICAGDTQDVVPRDDVLNYLREITQQEPQK